VEATAWAAMALIRDGRFHSELGKALNWLIEQKDPNGTWGTTHGTVLALQALLLSLGQQTETVDAAVSISVNGEKRAEIKVTPVTSDVFRQIDLTPYAKDGENRVDITLRGKGSLLYQVVGKYYVPWKPAKEKKDFDISVEYDRTELKRNDTVQCRIKGKNLRTQRAEMVMIDVGIPPGFRVERADLDDAVKKGTIAKYTIMSRQLLIYLTAMDAGQELRLSVPMKATLPMVAKAPESKMYEYYNPEVKEVSLPLNLKVE
jgi:hypothetical protein